MRPAVVGLGRALAWRAVRREGGLTRWQRGKGGLTRWGGGGGGRYKTNCSYDVNQDVEDIFKRWDR